MQLPEIIGQTYLTCGFHAARVVPFVLLHQEKERFGEWLDRGYGGEMAYLERSRDYRHDLRRLMPEVQSVVVTLTSYNRGSLPPPAANAPHIARYAWGEDYHRVIKRNLMALLERIRSYAGYGEAKGRGVVDSAPAFEKAWALRAGLGWIGRSSVLVNRELGSYTIIGLLLLDVPLPEDFVWPEPAADGCGACRRCLEACPADCLVSDKVLNASRCLSYQNKRREPPHEEVRPLLQGRIFGCDSCLEACPYNHTASAVEAGRNTPLVPVPERLNITRQQWLAMSEEEFRERFRGSPLLDTGLEKLKSNLE